MSLLPSARSRALRPAGTAGFARHLSALMAAARSRKGLAVLDDHLLRDIGLTRHQADTEAQRPFWDAPSHWKR